MKSKLWKAALVMTAAMMLFCPVYAGSMVQAETVDAGQITDNTGKWIQEGEDWYWQKADGSILRQGGWHILDGKRYFLANNSGRRKSGWLTYCGKKYYLEPKTGVMVTGWKTIGSKVYFFSRSGKTQGIMRTGTVLIDGAYYFFNSDGSRFRGWKTIKGYKYYYYKNGKGAVGWNKIDGNMYYFNPKNRVMKVGWATISGSTYYFKKNGHRTFGLANLGGKTYYFGSGGKLVRDRLAMKINNKYYKIDNKGVCTQFKKKVEILAIKTLDKVGWTPRDAYNYCARQYKEVSNDVPAGQNVADWYATMGFENGGVGDCYVLAAMFTQMAKILGLDAHFVMGSVPTRLSAEGAGPHGWCEIDLDGATYICDPDFEIESGWNGKTRKNGYMFVYGTKGTYKYQDGKRMN